MRKGLLFLSAILFLSVIANSQPDTLWTNTFGGSETDVGYSVYQTLDGGYIITGLTYSFPLWDNNIYLVKADSNGNEEWFQVFDIGLNEQGNCVQQTSDGGYIIGGTTGFYSDLDIFLIKTDFFGSQEWICLYDYGNTTDYGNCVQQTQDGGYIVTGATRHYGIEEYYDVWLIKTDASGDMLWDQTFGGGGDEMGNCVNQTNDRGYIITGWIESFGADLKNVYLIKTDSSGVEQWSYTYGGDGWDYGRSVRQTIDSGYIIAGGTNPVGPTESDAYLIKTDMDGNELWRQKFGGAESESGMSVQQTTDGGYIIGGETNSYGLGYDVYIVKADAAGNEQWYQNFGGNDTDNCYSVQQTIDGGYIVAGYTYSYGAGEHDVYLIRLEAEEPPEFTITLTPSNPPIQIPPGGGTFDFNIEVSNNGNTTLAFDMWTMATLPNGNDYGPIISIENYELNAGQSASRDRMQYVPMNAPPGIYTYDGYIGNYPNVIWDEDHFEFEKLGD